MRPVGRFRSEVGAVTVSGVSRSNRLLAVEVRSALARRPGGASERHAELEHLLADVAAAALLLEAERRRLERVLLSGPQGHDWGRAAKQLAGRRDTVESELRELRRLAGELRERLADERA